MTREDALYQKLLLAAGFVEQYELWLAEFVEKEDPLSDIVLDLSWCGGDFKEIVSCLHRFLTDSVVDDIAVAERLRLFVKEQYESGKLDEEGCMTAFYHFSAEMIGHSSIWDYMMALSDYYGGVSEGWYPEKKWKKAFVAFLSEGKMLKL